MNRRDPLSGLAFIAPTSRCRSFPRRAGILAVLAAITSSSPIAAAAQSGGYYAGKTVRVLVGVQVGGTADTAVRRFSDYLRRQLAGNPTVLVENMTGAGTNLVFNYL